MANRGRTIRQVERFEEEFEDLEPEFERRDEVLRGVQSVLNNSPETGHHIENGIFVIRTRFTGPQESDFAVFYRFDDEYVTLISIAGFQTRFQSSPSSS